jgi:hypothetical protein
MELSFSEEFPLSYDAFGAAIFQDILFVPKELKEACGENVPATAEELLALMNTYPGSFCTTLCWLPSHYERARRGFNGLLQGKVAEDLLNPVPFPQSRGRVPRSVRSVEIGYMVSEDDDE